MLIATTYYGGKDLFHGVPDLKEAKVIGVVAVENETHYMTHLIFELDKGGTYEMKIKQEK